MQQRGMAGTDMTRTTQSSLPYDMGNAGDLLKHGILAEIVRWRLEAGPRRPIRFFDLFGGEPFGSARNEAARVEIIRCVEALSGTALQQAQPEIGDGTYYGSGNLVRYQGERLGRDRVSVLVSDGDEDRRERLRKAGFSMLEETFPSCGKPGGYDAYIAFDIIRRETGADDLILIDPFKEFLGPKGKAEDVVRQIGETARRSAVLLFALNKNPFNRYGRKFDALLENHLKGAWIMTCPPIFSSSVEGESKYFADVVLAAPILLEDGCAAAVLRTRLDGYTACLANALRLSQRGLQMLRSRIVRKQAE